MARDEKDESVNLLNILIKQVGEIAKGQARTEATLESLDRRVTNIDGRMGKVESAIIRIDTRHAGENGVKRGFEIVRTGVKWWVTVLLTIAGIIGGGAIMEFLRNM